MKEPMFYETFFGWLFVLAVIFAVYSVYKAYQVNKRRYMQRQNAKRAWAKVMYGQHIRFK